MKEHYLLEVTPISETSAALTKIIATDEKNIFAHAAIYGGKYVKVCPNEIIVEYGIHENKIYEIEEIRATAISYKSLKIIRIGKNVNKINWNMYACRSLENIFVDKDNQYFYDIDGVLFYKKELIAFPQGRRGTYRIPNGIKKIGNNAFKSCNLSEIIFPNTLEVIGINAFYECRNITEFILPSSIRCVYFNNNINNEPITQKFFLSSDRSKSKPLTITDITEMFKVKKDTSI
jgi:hypothetical protein